MFWGQVRRFWLQAAPVIHLQPGQQQRSTLREAGTKGWISLCVVCSKKVSDKQTSDRLGHSARASPFSAKLMISELSSSTSLLIGCPSRLGISTRPSSRSFPAWSFRSAVTMAAFDTGCVMLGLSRICSRLRMCLFTASRKSTFSRPDSGSSGWATPQDAQVSRDAVCASASVPGAAVQRMERTQATKSASRRRQLLIFCSRRSRITFPPLCQNSNHKKKREEDKNSAQRRAVSMRNGRSSDALVQFTPNH